MKHILIVIAVMLSIFFQSCSSKEPDQNDIIGAWVSSDKAELVFNKDGSFIGDSIPTRFGFMASDSITQRRFSGSGKWTLRKGQAQWEVYLDFNQASVGKNGCAFPVLISGSNGVLENNPPWYLFLWQEEEGGQRYEFKRK
jgi:hypothetical protein